MSAANTQFYLDESNFRASSSTPTAMMEKANAVTSCIIGREYNQTNVINAMYQGKLFAIGLFDFSINWEVFNGWAGQVLIAQLSQDNIVVMNNAAFHKGRASNLLIVFFGETGG